MCTNNLKGILKKMQIIKVNQYDNIIVWTEKIQILN